MSDSQFVSLVDRLGTGDSEAAGDLMLAYGAEIRRFIRFRMRDSVLRRLHDSIDVEQSVFRRFFKRAGTGDLRLATEDELRAYLFTLAKHRVSELKREQSAQKRKASFVEEDSSFQLGQLAGTGGATDSAAAESELMMEVRSIVGTDDWEAVVQRLEGRTWKEVARDRGTKPDTLRKRLQTALQLVKARLTSTE
ncbi:RNA polymerase sigma factor [Rhodopirellula baltica]|uniref:Protein containing RNA polymerase sigma-70 domain n=3 Tax=Rhodopirellula baltica TaxID=265606 RepID=F2AQS5_RHOBT|nr:ECF-type sigma factor [Rhodopirellula baltica]EGF27979.1 protein containing RNA polymerase sigma-70 domain [Rhodopirellula baltica WH47]EKK03404.1 protein containing RNA polymerase sigma-70 domain protein [Rhodopirellula baltica SH28]ELP30049.1 protein containing RNA polymerase sigma-70 domain protein [Rhodopirellula baltica SWK14]